MALKAGWLALLVGSVLGTLGMFLGLLSPAALAVLVWGAFWGWMYSLRPLVLAWRGWGELDNAMLGGVALPVYAYVVQAGPLDPRVVLIFIPFGMLVFINLLATTWADREADAKVGKFTLATHWPVIHLRLLYLVVSLGFFYLVMFGRLLFPRWSFWAVCWQYQFYCGASTRIHASIPHSQRSQP